LRPMISGYYNLASLYYLKFPMTLDPLLSAPQPIPVHAIAALVAMVLGGLQLWGPKGTRNHRTLGYIWVGLMAIVAFSGFFIHVLKLVGPFSPIHLLSVLTLASLWYAIRAAR